MVMIVVVVLVTTSLILVAVVDDDALVIRLFSFAFLIALLLLPFSVLFFVSL